MGSKSESTYFIMILNAIAKKYGMFIYEAYQYLYLYKGVAFLQEFYDVEHTLSTDDVVDDVMAICGKNGVNLI
jgi:hypothetical protein